MFELYAAYRWILRMQENTDTPVKFEEDFLDELEDEDLDDSAEPRTVAKSSDSETTVGPAGRNEVNEQHVVEKEDVLFQKIDYKHHATASDTHATVSDS